MASNLPTRVCDGCGQIWSSGRFLDPTSKADCGHCGGGLVHRRRLPDGLVAELQQRSVLAPAAAIVAAHSTNGASSNGAAAQLR